ncbi:M20/M25/M40 family metallo-hydrolase [Pararhodobacter sp.]|uniref:M20/M25/M40 family metallo-hydrolase n=1 Tax=Pararhodobacter sp. TaxID=2127056 RepID=UPI002FDD0272
MPPPDAARFVRWIEDLSGAEAVQAVPFGTEAGLFHAAGIPSVICGPGDIARAHRADEYITPGELTACCAMLRRLGEGQAAG